MDFRFSPQEEQFRHQFAVWLKETLPPDWDPHVLHTYESAQDWSRAHRDFHKKLQAAGYSGMHYPKEYGGQGRTLTEEIIVQEEIASTCIELRLPGIVTFGMAGPLLLLCGNEAQKKEFLPKLLDGTQVWCQGFSEPNAGSDVVNVSTKAVKDGNDWIVSGQKIWTSFAHMADYCLLLVRTDPGVAKHKGLSYLLMDMTLPGVDVRPITQITGEAEFNEVFLEDVRVPGEMMVGAPGQGWRMAVTTLMFERVIGDAMMAGIFGRYWRSLAAAARQTKRSGRSLLEDPVFRQELGQSLIEVMILKYHGYRNLSPLLAGGLPGPEGSIGKLLWSEHSQRLSDTALRHLGPAGQLLKGSAGAIMEGTWPGIFLVSKGNTIAAGTSEINRNIVGERVLGLPKDVSRAEIR